MISRVLFLTESREDYLADSLLHGLISLGLEVVEADLENNLLYLKGAVPGSKNSYVEIQEAIKNKNKSSIKERVEKYKASLAEMQSTKKDKKKKDKKTETPATEKTDGEGADKK